MHPATPAQKTFAHGFPPALEELRTLPDFVEPDLVLGLYGLLRAAGVSIIYCEADVLSGNAAQFIYSREHPECAQLSFVAPVETLFRALDMTWKEVTPSGSSAAFAVIRDWIAQGRLTLARFKEPILIYGFAQADSHCCLLGARPRARLQEEMISQADCDRKYWRYPLDEGNVLICVDEAPRQIDNLTSLACTAARRAVRLWHMANLAGCSIGDHAYRRLTADVADSDVDFTSERTSAWMGAALWKQWTARASSQQFFKRVAPRFGGKDRGAVEKAAFCYEQCVESWKHWAQYLGPTWSHNRHGFIPSYPDDFVARWRNPELRAKGSHWIEEARGWEEKAIGELTKILR
ncbi:MAG TPA: hypothetical protein VGL38_16340 [bacterium]|jgi:hypothetical protein